MQYLIILKYADVYQYRDLKVVWHRCESMIIRVTSMQHIVMADIAIADPI